MLIWKTVLAEVKYSGYLGDALDCEACIEKNQKNITTA